MCACVRACVCVSVRGRASDTHPAFSTPVPVTRSDSVGRISWSEMCACVCVCTSGGHATNNSVPHSPGLLLHTRTSNPIGQGGTDLPQRNPTEVEEPRGEVVAVPEEHVVLAEVRANQNRALNDVTHAQCADAVLEETDVVKVTRGADLWEE